MAGLRTARVLVADDHPVVSAGLMNLLRPHCGAVTSAHTLPEVWGRLHDGDIDLVVLDVAFGQASSLTELPRLRTSFPAVRFLILTAHGAALRASALQAGAHGFVSKTADPGVLLEAMRQVITASEAAPVPEHGVVAPTEPPGLAHLTPRQSEVFQCLLEGLTQQETATALGVSRRTVEFHINEVRRRSGIRRMSLLLAWVREHERAPDSKPGGPPEAGRRPTE